MTERAKLRPEQMETLNRTICPSCGRDGAEDTGPLAPFKPGTFGGAPWRPHGPSVLMRCASCGLRYRHPYPDPTELESVYEALPGDVWETRQARSYWPAVRDAVMTAKRGNRLLDIGCFNGDFLSYLPDEFDKHGVEPNARASAAAKARGLTIVAPTIEAMGARASYDVITMIDVLEHLPRPLEALRRAAEALKPGGILVVFTGATDTWPWRLFGRLYWYCALPEHVSFFGAGWFRWAAERTGLRLEARRVMPSDRPSPDRALKQFLQIAAFAAVARIKESGPGALLRLPLFRRVAKWPSVPLWTAAPDHQLVVLRK